MIGAHGIEAVRIQRTIAQELISRTVRLIRSRARDYVDLSATRATHLSGVASSLNLEFLNCVR